MEEQAPLINYEKGRLSLPRNRAAREMESDVISHNKFPSLFLINLWQLFFHIFVISVNGDVLNAQTSEILDLK